ncbi:neuronal tyrosine-phosphorylated phosphoinositide-3-kinase adapter 2 [Electrophorus electricus]|uniref:neuronal tyrosine-phosphorylated phosphoinositide-3-kinase adapter 2 n=1 Tax=Electrophorus electricus TaxID=8005 RepID=UPI0015D07E29|nr:neuronal tyrosine-phosphorylated phosphoinositide-3-kinase adapter 2 [Electrophorus electricus]XP_035390380.1 neuronal tyrosine-phosphorylated phosphoinositide-3-kinase adapter 2 [Electrophorus electricus]XP_035390381.1 neuronal tyrosine-phosphorylated phosphoinositide-3-kinase adapter 2 [Electrophorus electricus]XP_035390382.1 neuronal tyrosine-phosphorylated phosphoinositide-3-kinase adapter 2 [Electrophorus electricus]
MDAPEDESVRFLQYVEDSGLRAYDELVIQNASDIARESDRLRNHAHWAYLQEQSEKKRHQEEAIKRIEEDVVGVAEGGPYASKHFRMGSMTMPAPQDRLAAPCGQGFAVRSQSLHSVGGAEEEGGSPTLRKQPPPKPKRDPNTKLSTSSETVNVALGPGKGSKEPDKRDGSQSRPCSEEYRRMPPPKPKRNPNTQLSTSFDESYIHSHGMKFKSASLPRRQKKKSVSQNQSPALDTDEEAEPVYIEMVGNILRDFSHITGGNADDEGDQGESVYEEMKYPTYEEIAPPTDHSRWEPCPMHIPDVELTRPSTPRGSLCDIPAPFPNLLTHRPPLLVFPPAPAQCSPNSDESPLTPLEVTKLPMLENVGYGKPGSSPTAGDPGQPLPAQQPSGHHAHHHHHHHHHHYHHHHKKSSDGKDPSSAQTITVSGRSSAPPLPSALYKSGGAAAAHGYPRSHSACPSPVSMGRALTPLSLKRPPPYDALLTGTIPRSTSGGPQGTRDGRSLSISSGVHGGSMQNVSTASAGSAGSGSGSGGRGSRTPTSPLDELNNLLSSGKNALRKGSGSRKNKELCDIDSKVRSHSTDCKDRNLRSSSPKAQEWDTPSGQSATPTRMGRSSVSPTTMLGGGATEPKAACKLGRSASTSGVPSPVGTPQRHAPDPSANQGGSPCQMLPLPWACGDNTMMEMIEKKRHLCKEIKARHRPAEKALCKQESMPILPSWKKTNGGKKYGPPPYSAQTTIFWDTAI